MRGQDGEVVVVGGEEEDCVLGCGGGGGAFCGVHCVCVCVYGNRFIERNLSVFFYFILFYFLVM